MTEQDEERQTGADELPTTELEDIQVMKQALDEERTKAEGYLANWQRSEADLVNYKRRNEQEKAEISKYANTTLILSLLPVLDDFERAFSSIPTRKSHMSWVEGFRLIEQKLRIALEAQGLSQIKALGETFDPNFHEAIRQDKGEEGVVIEELQKGYRLHDRVIRATRVVVGNGEQEEINKEA